MSFVAAAHYDNASSSSGVCDKPAGTVDDDLMVALVKRVDTTGPNSTPSGWTLLATDAVVTGHWLYYKIAASEGANYTWGWAAAGRLGVTIASYRGGFNVASPIDVYSNTQYVTSDTICRAASMSVSAANSIIIFLGMFHGGASGTFTPPTVPAALTEDVDRYDSGSRLGRTVASLQPWSGSGATGDMDATISLTTADKHAFAVALTPSGAATERHQTRRMIQAGGFY